MTSAITTAPEHLTVPARAIAHARAGDKGNTANLAVFAYQPQGYALLCAQLTEEHVRAGFAHRQPGRIQRYLLPRLHGMNFVLEGVLDGGVNQSLNLDAHGKSLSFLLLSLPLQVPSDQLAQLGPG